MQEMYDATPFGVVFSRLMNCVSMSAVRVSQLSFSPNVQMANTTYTKIQHIQLTADDRYSFACVPTPISDLYGSTMPSLGMMIDMTLF